MQKRNNEERIDETTNAFLNIMRIPNIEFAFWQMGLKDNTGKWYKKCLVSDLTGLRLKYY